MFYLYFKRPFLELSGKTSKKLIYWPYVCVESSVIIKVSKVSAVYEFCDIEDRIRQSFDC